MVGLNTYISGLDLSALKEYCVNHGRITQYAKGDYFVKEGEEFYFQLCLGLQINYYFCTQKAQYEYRYHRSHLGYW